MLHKNTGGRKLAAQPIVAVTATAVFRAKSALQLRTPNNAHWQLARVIQTQRGVGDVVPVLEERGGSKLQGFCCFERGGNLVAGLRSCAVLAAATTSRTGVKDDIACINA